MMKIVRFTCLLLFFAILTCSSGAGQEKQTDETEVLRKQLRQVETVPVDRKSAVIQDLHKRALLSARKQLVNSIEDDLKALRTMQVAVGASDLETRKGIEAQIQTLTLERNELTARIK